MLDTLLMRAAANPSISSRKMTEGAAARALQRNEVLCHTFQTNLLEHYVANARCAFKVFIEG